MMDHEEKPFDGVLVTNADIVQTLFDIGDFRYRFEGEGPAVWVCTSQMQCDKIKSKVDLGLKIFIEPPAMRRQH